MTGPRQTFTFNEVQTLTRLALARAMNKDVQTIDDIYKACKYPTELTTDDYERMYAREGVAAKVVDIWADECWDVCPDVYEDEDITVETEFEKAVEQLHKDHDLWGMCRTADKQAGVGRYGVIYLSFNDAATVEDLSRPPKAWPQDADHSVIENSLPPAGTTIPESKIQFFRVLPEKYAKVLEVETNLLSPRYGRPKKYNLTFAGDNGDAANNTDAATYAVHWTRVIHIADNVDTSPIAGRPRQQRPYNRLIDLLKAYGGSSQGLWNGGFPGTAFETAPGFEDAEIEDESAVRDQLASFSEGYQRWLFIKGLKANPLNGNLENPAPFIEAYLQNVGLTIGVPWRKLLGSEQGQLASGEDGETWDDRVIARQGGFCTRQIIMPLIRRLIWFGALPLPANVEVEWPERAEPKRSELAATCLTYTQAFRAYVEGNVAQLVTPAKYLEIIAKLDLEDVIQIEEDAKSFTDLETANDLKAQQAELAVKGAEKALTDPPPTAGGGPPKKPGAAPPKAKPPAKK
jgi:hypothetical protein